MLRGELWEAQEELWERWEALYIKRLSIDRPRGRYVYWRKASIWRSRNVWVAFKKFMRGLTWTWKNHTDIIEWFRIKFCHSQKRPGIFWQASDKPRMISMIILVVARSS